MNELSLIEQPVAQEFRLFHQMLAESLDSDVHTVRLAVHNAQKVSGKHIRPLLLLLTAKACGNVNDNSIHAALVVELLHIASLIHDDVVDNSTLRRGIPSLNATYDNRVSVLVGDFILADALAKTINSGRSFVAGILTNICKAMVEGEIKQLENANNASLDEYDYFFALEKKTASLLAACTQIGAITANATPNILQKCNTLGLMMGYCFQIKDDILDYADSNNTGKPAGNDIREGKITLPLLHALKQLATPEQQNVLQLLKSKSLSNDNVQYIQQLAIQHGGIQYAQMQMDYFKNKAINILNELPDSDAKNSLQLLAEFIVQRNN